MDLKFSRKKFDMRSPRRVCLDKREDRISLLEKVLLRGGEYDAFRVNTMAP
jgi:hypothetical protein